MKRLSLLFIGIVAIALAACSALVPTFTPTPMPTGMVDVGGYRLFYQCSGQGTPTVILEAGMGAASTSWSKVMAGLEDTTRVCAYDRANLGQSDAPLKSRTFEDAARDLDNILTRAGIGSPYILVGHSLGGMLVRVFADEHPGEVVGLVLVDVAHPEMGLRLLAGLPPEAADEMEILKTWRQLFTWMANLNGSQWPNPEGWDIQASLALLNATKPLGDLSLVVISQSPNNPFVVEEIPPALVVTNARLQQIWQELQAELAGLSSNSLHVTAAQAGHNIPGEDPALIVEAIRQLVAEFRDR